MTRRQDRPYTMQEMVKGHLTDGGKPTQAKLELLSKKQEIDEAYRKASEDSFMIFTRGLIIDSQTGPRVFENCMAVFQRECFEDIAPNLHALRDGKMPDCRRYWIERTKKASKDADLAIIVLWLIAFAKRPFYMQVGAGDKTQAAIVKERILHLIHYNPWLNDHIEVIQWQVKSKKSMVDGHPLATMDIMSSDIAGAHGGTPALLIINELSHVTRFEFVENMMDNADGVAQGMVIIATNAGTKGTKAEVWRNSAIGNEEWHMFVVDRPAPWHSKRTIDDARKRNPHSRFMRLWYGRWVSGKGDALNEEQVERCFRLKGPVQERELRWVYIGGLDLGISHDHAGLVITAVNEFEQRLKLAYMKSWPPLESTGKVDLIAVEKETLSICRWLGTEVLLCDPHQAELMMQRLTKRNLNVRELTFTPNNLTLMATSLVQVVEEGRLELYDNEEGVLRRDLGKFNIVEKSYGLRLEAVSDEFGHADVGTALAITLPYACEILRGVSGGLRPDDDLYTDTGEDPTEEEMKVMPQEFKEIHIEESKRPRKKRESDPFADFD